MNDMDRLVLMTKLAVYDKKTGFKDRKIAEYFPDDYVYRNNCLTRIYVLIGCLIVLFLYWLHKIVIGRVDVLTIDLRAAFIGNLVFICVVLAVYTLIGSLKATREYNRAQRRLQKYFTLMNMLDRDPREDYAEEASNHGAGFSD